jgi:uncharacterized membrane protein HdeD (DUF308 family)
MQTRTTILDSEMTPTPGGLVRPRIATTWREPLTRGILAIVMGVVLFAFPLSAAFVVAIAFGVFVLVDGGFAIAHATRNAHPDAGRWWAMLVRGIVGVLVGLFCIVFPGVAAAALGTLIAIWAILAGALEIGAGFRIRHDVPREALLVLAGVLTIVVGAVLLFMPFVALTTLIWVFAVYAILVGAALVTYALQLRRRSAAL